MPTTFIGCEACGTPVESPQVLGVLIRRSYCPRCAEPIVTVLKERDLAHERAARMFQQENAELREILVSSLPHGAKLPDEP